MKSNLISVVRKFLSESPQMVEGGGDLTYWRTIASGIRYKHDVEGKFFKTQTGTNVSVVTNENIPNRYSEYHRQYAVRSDAGDVRYRADFKDHSLKSHPKLRGTYSSMVVKVNANDNAKVTTKEIYDHELSNHDYLISDANQYDGGKHIWKTITKSYENEGKHLYLTDGDSVSKITHDEIIGGENRIWGSGTEFQNRRLIVSNNPL